MKFASYVTESDAKYLKTQYRQYCQFTPLSKQEKRLLREWVKAGNSVFRNPYSIFYPNGDPVDFVLARRMFVENDFETTIRERNSYQCQNGQLGSTQCLNPHKTFDDSRHTNYVSENRGFETEMKEILYPDDYEEEELPFL